MLPVVSRIITVWSMVKPMRFQAASTIRTNAEVNTPGYDGPTVGSVMDYVAANINYELGEAQGPYATTQVGPYDMWAIAFGYGPEDKVAETLKRSAEPEHLYVSQVAMSTGSDPRNMTWDMGKDNLAFAEKRIALVQALRQRPGRRFAAREDLATQRPEFAAGIVGPEGFECDEAFQGAAVVLAQAPCEACDMP